MICGLLQIYYFAEVTWYKEQNPGLGLFVLIIITIVLVMVVVGISLLDALHTKRYSKIMVSMFVGILFTFLAVATQFSIDPDNDDSVITIIGTKISLWMLIISTWRILGIFSWKQAISTYLATRHGRNKCVTIANYPSIYWEDGIRNNDGDDMKHDKNDEEKNIPTMDLHFGVNSGSGSVSNSGSGTDGCGENGEGDVGVGVEMKIYHQPSEEPLDLNDEEYMKPQRSIGGIVIDQWDINKSNESLEIP